MILYTKKDWERLIYQFPGSENIDTNYAQAHQDIFVLTLLNGKRNGTFLEIGAFDGAFISNTLLLEKKFEWSGTSIDIERSAAESFRRHNRKANFVLGDALEIDYSKLLSSNFEGNRIDYLMLDIEPCTNTLECLKKIPFSDFRFSVITYETDFYDPNTPQDVKEHVREESRKIIESHGYLLMVGDVSNTRDNIPFEDWYVDPEVVDPNIIKLFEKNRSYMKTSDKYLLKN